MPRDRLLSHNDALDPDENLSENHEGTAEGAESSAAASEAPSKAAPPREYPYINLAAERGAYFIGTEDREVTRPMNEHDLADAIESQQDLAADMERAEEDEAEALADEKKYKKLLDGAREKLREAQNSQKELGKNLKSIVLEIGSKRRRTVTKVNLTVTTGNELIAVDAETGEELERRIATSAEIARTHNKSQSMYCSADGPNKAGPTSSSGDSGQDKGNPEEQLGVTCSRSWYWTARAALLVAASMG